MAILTHSVDLTNCDREPIHIPGTIQVHGGLLVCSIPDGRVLRRSDNLQDLLGLDADPLGRLLRDLFGAKVVHDLLNALAKVSDPRRPALLRNLALGTGALDVVVHRQPGVMLVEFEPAEDGQSESALEIARTLIARTQALTDRAMFNERVPRLIQAMLQYDRVMLYEFAPDGSGKVVGEARRPHLESFLGQHFPAADIPQQARTLYLKNTIRVIADSAGPSSPIRPALDPSGAPLDLSFAHLRSVSPIHLEYLRNMGVGASMSISIISDGVLWGLVACHHYGPKAVSMAKRTAAELYGDFLSLHLTSLHHRQRVSAHVRTRTALDRILADMSFHHDIDNFVSEALPEISRLIPCDGIGLWMNGNWTAHGAAPPAARIPELARLAGSGDPGTILTSHALSERTPEAQDFAAEAAGMLVIPLSQLPRNYLFFFRREKVGTLDWAGDPNKTYATGVYGDRLTPRKSFAVWQETVRNQSDPWTEDDRITAEALLLGLREVILRQSEILSIERRKTEVRQRLLNDELNHRVKNILALIKSLINQRTDGQDSIESFIAGLTGRILALSNAHDQVVRADGGGSLHQLLAAELAPYNARQIVIDGQDIGLNSAAYSVMALVLHELATNAAKYGSLSVADGRLLVVCAIDADGDCTIHWQETGGPKVRAPIRRGFGSVLLERSVPFDLQGRSDVDYHEDGVTARIVIPGRFIAGRPDAPEAGDPAAPADAAPLDFRAMRVLLVEDQFVIALDAEDMLRSFGVETIVTAATATDALASIASAAPDIAVLDVNLGGGNSLAVAEELMRLNVPFVFATGYGDAVSIPDRMRALPIIRKPYSSESLRLAMHKAFQV